MDRNDLAGYTDSKLLDLLEKKHLALTNANREYENARKKARGIHESYLKVKREIKRRMGHE